MTRTVVLDTSVLLAVLQQEPAARQVIELFREAQEGKRELAVSAINLGEIVAIVEQRLGTQKVVQLLGYLQACPLQVYDATWDRVVRAARLKARYPILYIQAFAAALAQELQATLLTVDPELRVLGDEIRIHWLENGA